MLLHGCFVPPCKRGGKLPPFSDLQLPEPYFNVVSWNASPNRSAKTSDSTLFWTARVRSGWAEDTSES